MAPALRQLCGWNGTPDQGAEFGESAESIFHI